MCVCVCVCMCVYIYIWHNTEEKQKEMPIWNEKLQCLNGMLFSFCLQRADCRFLNPLNAELNPIRHLLALVVARHIVHVSRIRVKEACGTYGGR